MNTIQLSKSNGLEFGQISWRYYHKIKKKAMEQEFSWSGFLVSMSIAFFIVVIASFGLNLMHQSVAAAHAKQKSVQNIYQLERAGYLEMGYLSDKKQVALYNNSLSC